MLTIVRKQSAADLDRLSVAATHLQAAVAHINNEAQRHIPASARGDSTQLEELRLIVRALCDVIDALKSAHRNHPRRVPDLESGLDRDFDRLRELLPSVRENRGSPSADIRAEWSESVDE